MQSMLYTHTQTNTVYAIVMMANVLGGFILMFHDGSISFFLMSIIYACMFTPASFLCWYVN